MLPHYGSLLSVVAWLSGAGSGACHRDADYDPRTVAPFYSGLCPVICCEGASVLPRVAGSPGTDRGADSALDRAGVCAVVSDWGEDPRLGAGHARPYRTRDSADMQGSGLFPDYRGRAVEVVLPRPTG